MKKTLSVIFLAIITMITLTACSNEAKAGKYIDQGLATLKESFSKESADKALDLFLKAEEMGDSRGSFYTGYIYFVGYPAWKDGNVDKAIDYLNKCTDSNPYANLLLGFIYHEDNFASYFDKSKSEESVTKAMSLFDGYEDNIDPYFSRYILGRYYQYFSDPIDYDRAFELYSEASELGNPLAINYLGNLYSKEKNDEKKALECYERALNLGCIISAANLGMDYAEGNAVPKDKEKANEYYKMAVAGGCPSAFAAYGFFLENTADSPEDYEKVMDYYLEAYERGSANVTVVIGYNYYIGLGVPLDYDKAFEWFSIGSQSGSAEAMNNLASCYEEGIGVEQDYAKAFEWYQKAADEGYSNAMESLAMFYEEGLGCEKDPQMVAYWKEKAAR